MVALAYTGMADASMGQQDNIEAIEWSRKALEINRNEYGIASAAAYRNYNTLGVLYPTVGHSMQALESFKMALRYLVPAKGENHPEVVRVYKGMLFACIMHDDVHGMLEYAEKVLAIQRATVGESHVDTAMAYEALGLVYRSRGGPRHHGNYVKQPEQYKRAADCLSKAHAIFRRVYGDYHIDTARVCMQLGGVYVAIANVAGEGNALAAVAPQDAIAMCFEPKMFHANNPAVHYYEKTIFYREWGMIYKVLKQHDMAIAEFGCALHCFEGVTEFQSRDTLQMAEVLQSLGSCYVAKGDLPAAMDCYQHMVRVYEVLFREREDCYNVRLARAHMDVAGVYHDQGEKQLAMQHTERAIHIYVTAGRSVSHEKDPEMAMVYAYMGNMCNDFGRGLAVTLEHFRKALRIYSDALGEDDINTAQMHTNIALSFVTQDQFQQALPHYVAAYAGYKNHYGENHERVAAWAFDYANTLTELGETEEALAQFQKALSVRRRVYGCEHITVAETLSKMGAVQMDRGNLVATIECFRETKAIYCALFGRNHTYTVNASQNLSTAFEIRTAQLTIAAGCNWDPAVIAAALHDA